MKLREIKIKNFRCLRDVSLVLDDTTVLIGENNSGKTALLEALRLVLTRSLSSRGALFDEFDYHLPTNADSPKTSPGIEVVLWFREDQPDEWEEGILQQLDGVTQLDPILSRSSLGIRVTSKWDGTRFQQKSEFLSLSETPLVGKTPQQIGAMFQRFFELVRFFYLSALRDSDSEFSHRSSLWSRILKDMEIPPDQMTTIAESLQQINSTLLQADPRLEQVRSHIENATKIMGALHTSNTSIQAVPLKPWELMSKSQVAIKSHSDGADLPLERHGQGIQSLAVLFLFQAYISVLMKKTFRSETVSLLALEEPEGHLHPHAIRTLGKFLQDLSGQKILSTHSPFLLQDMPLKSFRIFKKVGNQSRILSIKAQDSTNPLSIREDELPEIERYTKSRRGEILFARAWLLCEGQSEGVVLPFFAEVLEKPFSQHGVSVIECQLDGAVWAFVKLASALEIPWLMVADSDKGYSQFHNQLVKIGLSPQEIATRLLPLPGIGLDIEAFLLEQGFFDDIWAILLAQAESRRVSLQQKWWVVVKRMVKDDDWGVPSGANIEVIRRLDGSEEVRVFTEPKQTPKVIVQQDPTFVDLKKRIVLAEMREHKVWMAQMLVTHLRQLSLNRARIPQFFLDTITRILEMAR